VRPPEQDRRAALPGRADLRLVSAEVPLLGRPLGATGDPLCRISGHRDEPSLDRKNKSGIDADNQEAYYDMKDPVCDIFIGGAEIWAASMQWMPGPADC
jgi:hypothetical protein